MMLEVDGTRQQWKSGGGLYTAMAKTMMLEAMRIKQQESNHRILYTTMLEADCTQQWRKWLVHYSIGGG